MREDNEAMLRLMERLGPDRPQRVEEGTLVAYTRLEAARRRNAA